MKTIIFILLLFLHKISFSQILRSSLPVSYTSVGTYSSHFSDVFSSITNQASLAMVKNITVGVYSEKRFMLKELSAFSAAISFPCLKSGAAAVAIDYTGFANYNQSHAGLACGKQLGSKVDLGIQFNYDHTNLAGYGSASALCFEVGTIFHLTDKIKAGFHVYNPVGGKFGKNTGEKLASVYSFGLGYEASEKLFLGCNVIKEESQPVAISVCLHYAFESQFFVRAGMSSSVGEYFAGAGILWKNMRLDIAANWHTPAGLTPCMLLIFTLSKSKSGSQ